MRGGEGLLEPQQPVGGALRVIQQPFDPAEVETLVLKVANQLQSRDVLGPVVADPKPDLGRGEQPARLMRPDVAHRHAGLRGELLDRELMRGVGIVPVLAVVGGHDRDDIGR